MKRAVVAGLAALFGLAGVSGPAFAQLRAPVSPPPVTPEAIAAAKAEGDALLKAAQAEALFDNETGRDGHQAIILRHKASGFRCVLNPGKAVNKVEVFKSLRRGDDVGCTTQTFSDVRSLYLFKAPESTEQALLDRAGREVQGRYPSAKLYTPKPPRPGKSGMTSPLGASTPLTASYMSDDGSDRIVIGKVGDWAVEYLFSGGKEVADLGPVLDSFWTTTVMEGQGRAQAASQAPSQAPSQPDAAQAETPAAAGARITPEAARAEAAVLVARAGAGDLFEDASKDNLPGLRHKLSGFVCTFEPGQADNAVTIYPGGTRGEDVSCTTRSVGAINTMYMTKFPVVLSADDALKVYLREIKQAHPDVAMATGTFGNMTTNAPSAPARRTARLTYAMNGEKAFSRLSVAVVNGWVIEQRITAPLADAMTADLLGEVMMMGSVDRMAGRLPD
jgi:hypothetical protein